MSEEINKSEADDPLFGVMVEDTFVLGWQIEETTFIIECEISLWPGNKYYEAPKENEWTCYKKGQFILKNTQGLNSILSIENVSPVGIEKEIDYGTLDSATINDNLISIVGPFGEVSGLVSEFEYKINV